jgi:hypothetical protein
MDLTELERIQEEMDHWMDYLNQYPFFSSEEEKEVVDLPRLAMKIVGIYFQDLVNAGQSQDLHWFYRETLERDIEKIFKDSISLGLFRPWDSQLHHLEVAVELVKLTRLARRLND